MRIRQVSVFMEKALARFREVTELFHDAGINIRAHSLVGHSDTPYKILRMIVDDTQAAVTVLKNRGLSVKVEDVLAVEVDGARVRAHQPDAHDVCEKAAMVLSFDDLDRAIKALTDQGAPLIASEQF